MDKRRYMTIIAKFYDWCSENNINLDNINDNIIERYIKYNANNKEIKTALDNFKSYM